MARRPFSNTRTPNATGTWAALVLAAAAPVASGCSFLFSEGAPADHRALESFQCGESFAPPVLDSIGAGLLALTAIGAARNEDQTVAKAAPGDQQQTRHDTNVAIGVSLAFAVVDVASAVYGYHAVGDCRDAKGTRLAQVTRARLLPPPYGVPPYGEPPPFWPPPAAPTFAPPPAPLPPPAVPAPLAPPATPSP